MRALRLPVVLLVLLPLLAGCASPDDEPGTPTPETNEAAPGGDAAANATGAPVELSVSLVERPAVGVPPMTMAIDPAQLQAAAGSAVRLTVANAGQGPHNLVIEGLAESDLVDAGGETILEFVAAEKGEYAMYCSVGGDGPTGHRAQGMSGTFTVA